MEDTDFEILEVPPQDKWASELEVLKHQHGLSNVTLLSQMLDDLQRAEPLRDPVEALLNIMNISPSGPTGKNKIAQEEAAEGEFLGESLVLRDMNYFSPTRALERVDIPPITSILGTLETMSPVGLGQNKAFDTFSFSTSPRDRPMSQSVSLLSSPLQKLLKPPADRRNSMPDLRLDRSKPVFRATSDPSPRGAKPQFTNPPPFTEMPVSLFCNLLEAELSLNSEEEKTDESCEEKDEAKVGLSIENQEKHNIQEEERCIPEEKENLYASPVLAFVTLSPCDIAPVARPSPSHLPTMLQPPHLQPFLLPPPHPPF